MELTEEQRAAIEARITDLEHMRDRLVEQANLELARILARLDELQKLLQPE
ncbi:MAG TPA: hypothetical protein PKW83_13670 [Verrucomicrobiota bacterium]|nr:hypothetical protein [Verrucomicrobiota bacterium]